MAQEVATKSHLAKRRRSLTAEEQETIIRFDESQGLASVFTYNRRWQKHLEEKLGLKATFKNTKGGREYELPKSRILLPRAPRKVSEATLLRLRVQGFKKQAQ
jgi:hypothetical protein